MTDFLTAQLPFIVSLQRAFASSPALVSVWKALSFLGDEQFLLLLLPLIYWCFSVRRGLQLGVLVIGGDALNLLLKLLLSSPRPYWFGAPIQALGRDDSFGMPSGHAQNAVAIWFFLAIVLAPRLGRASCFAAATGLVLLISLSRIALGVHFPTDILGGWIIGAFWLWLVLKYWPAIESPFLRRKVWDQVTTAFVFAAVYICIGVILNDVRVDSKLHVVFDPALFNAADARGNSLQAVFTRGGTLLGLLAGMGWQYRRLKWKVSGTSMQLVGQFLLGLVGILIIWKGLGKVLPAGEDMVALVLRAVRYGLLSAWVVWWAPLWFQRMRQPRPPRSPGQKKMEKKARAMQKGFPNIAGID